MGRTNFVCFRFGEDRPPGQPRGLSYRIQGDLKTSTFPNLEAAILPFARKLGKTKSFARNPRKLSAHALFIKAGWPF